MNVKKETKKKKAKKPRQIPLKGISGKVKPTPQQLLIAKGLVEGKKKGEALVGAGVSPANARSNSAEILSQPGVKVAVRQVLQEAGVTPEKLGKVLNEGLAATKVISANLLVLGKEDSEVPCVDGFLDTTKMEPAEQEKIFIRVEDFPTRHRYLETGLKLLEMVPTEKTPGAPDLQPGEELNMIAQAEAEAAKRDITKFTVIRER